ncbi:MAG: DUF6232 family protein [Candidatus Promineifilaceae bacterium]
MAMDEITYFTGEGVIVTNTRFTVDETTYSISYIEAVETTVEEKETVKLKPAPIIVGVLLLLIGFLSIFAAMNIDEPPLIIFIALFGLASAFIGLVLFGRSFVTRKSLINHLILTTMVDKYDAFQSEDSKIFREVVEALSSAVENRDFT